MYTYHTHIQAHTCACKHLYTQIYSKFVGLGVIVAPIIMCVCVYVHFYL